MRYGDMTSNLVECFKFVLKGARQLPVAAIAEYTFYKLNEYFLKHFEEIDKLIGESEKPPNEIYPKKVAEWLEFQKEKSAMQRATCFDNAEMKYQVDEPGGTTRDGQSYGGRSSMVSLRTRHCTCERPSKYHWTCSHMMTACRMRNLPFYDGVVVRLHEFNLQTHQLTWVSRFHPFLDPSQWPEYHGPNIRPDPEMMVQPKVRRRTKRYRNDMDDLMNTREFGSGHFMEPRDRNQCGDCNETTHNKRTCKRNNASTSDVGPEVVQVLAVVDVVVQVVALLWAEDLAVVDVVVQVVALLWDEDPVVVDVVAFVWAEDPTVVDVVAFLWAEDPTVVVDVVVQVLVEVLWVEVGVVVEECSVTYPDHFRKYGGVSIQQGENGVGAEKDSSSEEQRLMERAAKKLREQDAAGAKKMERERQYEENEAKRKEDLKMFLEHRAYEKKMKEHHKKVMEQRHKEWVAKFKIAMAEGAAKRERENELFMERVLEEASKMRKREDEEEEERKKKKGKGPCSTQ
ncbi:hypothetical protein D1007_11091 [Hordeum vulgare]|nr:hypothetical protein D1007_11091 [Hordeum vulgare]